ncbi:hypothetical protein D3C87_1172290 [compost metagenome]
MDRLIKPIKAFINKYVEIEQIRNEPGNEMYRIGGGWNNYRKFFRIDVGNTGYRIVPKGAAK